MYRKICGQLGIDPLTTMKKYLVPDEDRDAPLTQVFFLSHLLFNSFVFQMKI